MKRITHTITDIFSGPTAKTLNEAVALGKQLDMIRKRELGLDLASIRGKYVEEFHWDDTHLIIELSGKIFLELIAENGLINIKIVDYLKIDTDREIIVDQTMLNGRIYVWNRQAIADYFRGTLFQNIEIGEQFVWIYFQNRRTLLHCVLQKIKECDSLTLAWYEGE